jgi:hypothetical protein
MIDNDEIVYSLNIEDIQTVANDVLNRDLIEDEIEKIKESLGKRIKWYEIIYESIVATIDFEDEEEEDVDE